MFKRLLLITMFSSIFVLNFVAPASAQVISKSGSVFISDLIYDSTKDAYHIDLDPVLLAGGHVLHRMWNTSDMSGTPSYENTIYFPYQMDFAYAEYNCLKYQHEIFYNSSGAVIGDLVFYPDQLINSACTSHYTPDGQTTPYAPPPCATCDLFNCPGWAEHMKGLEDIKNAIPPAPNWQQVADTFRDTIAPKVKSDLQDILGQAPDPPQAPQAPDPPPMLDGLNDGGLTAPTGENAPGLDNSTFTEGDIKNQAPVIQENQDPTGGFQINNPVDGLPSQDEFKQNAPNEGSAVLPAAPTESANPAPTPIEGANVAPSPTEGANVAPTPGSDGGTAPIPVESGTAPLPGSDGSTAPIPTESGTAPLPGG